MTREEIAESLKLLKKQAQKSHNDTAILDVKVESFVWVVESAIKALSQEPCDDAISREALKKMLIGLDKWHVKNKQFVNVGLLYDDVFFGIEQLPSVTQKGDEKNV